MTRRKFKFNKLVRDKVLIGMLAASKHVRPRYRKLDHNEYILELRNKINEETLELNQAETKEQVLQELINLQEAIIGLGKALGYSEQDFRTAQEKTVNEWGTFRERTFIDYVECDRSYKWYKHYRQNPDKYPEIIDEVVPPTN